MIEKYCFVSFLFEQRHSIAAENLPGSTGNETLQVLGLSPPSDCRNMRISTANVDIDVSTHNIVKFFTQPDSSVIIIWSCNHEEYDPQYKGAVLRKLEEALLSKEDQSTPKNLWYDCAEFAWVSYDVIDNCVFINHNQLNGIFKGEIKPHQEILWYRYAVKSLIEMLPTHYQIYAPTSALYNELSSVQIGVNITSRPYGHDVMSNTNFVRLPLEEMLANPNVAAKWNGSSEGLIWKYNH